MPTSSAGIAFTIGCRTNEVAEISFCFFDNNTVDNDSKGCDIFAQPFFISTVISSAFRLCYSSSISEKRVVIGTTNYPEILPNIPNSFTELYVVGDGLDHDSCGMELFPCKTISKAIELRTIHSISVGKGNFKEGEIEVGNFTIRMNGDSKNSSFIMAKSISRGFWLFHVMCGKLEATDYTIIHSSSESHSDSSLVVINGNGNVSFVDCIFTAEDHQKRVFEAPQMKIEGGELNFVNVVVKNFHSNEAFILLTSCSCMLFSNVNAREIHRTSGNGSFAEMEISSSSKVAMNNATIENCACDDGNGGGAFILINNNGELTIGNESLVSFASCSVPGDDEKKGKGGGLFLSCGDEGNNFLMNSIEYNNCFGWIGKSLFVCSKNLGLVINEIHFPKWTWFENSTENESTGFEDDNKRLAIPLYLFFVNPFPTPAFIGGGMSVDHSGCGFEKFPCATINHAVNLRFGSLKREIALNEGFTLSETLEMKVNEWIVSCLKKDTVISVDLLSIQNVTTAINIKNNTIMNNISFSINKLSISLIMIITCSSGTLYLNNCTAGLSAEFEIGNERDFCFICIINGSLVMNQFATNGFIQTDQRSLIERNSFLGCVECIDCSFAGIKKLRGNGGCITSECCLIENFVNERTIAIEGCNFSECYSGEDNAKGGGIYIELCANEKAIINGTGAFDGCFAGNDEKKGGKGGGIMVKIMDTENLIFKVNKGVSFSKEITNKAKYGKDIFVECNRGIFLEQVVNKTSFGFHDSFKIPFDEKMESGSEDGNEAFIIPLFVFLNQIDSKIVANGSGVDYPHCGFLSFPCHSISYCFDERITHDLSEIDVMAPSSIYHELSIPLYPICIKSTKFISGEEKMEVNVTDEGEATKDSFIECSSSFLIESLALVLKDSFNPQRCAFIHSISSIKMIDCSFNLVSVDVVPQIFFSLLFVTGGDITLQELVINEEIVFLQASPITIENGNKIEIKMSQIFDLKRESGNGGCLYVKGKSGIEPCLLISNCSMKSICEGGNKLKGGGIFICLEKDVFFEMNDVMFSCCKVPKDGGEEKGRGVGGGLFLDISDEVNIFELKKLNFENCDAWKGKQVFLSAKNLKPIVNKDHFVWELKADELKKMDEMNGWERSTSDEQFVIPLVVYLWNNFSNTGFIDGERGNDFSECGYKEVPCQTVDKLIHLRYSHSLSHPSASSYIRIKNFSSVNFEISFEDYPPLNANQSVSFVGEISQTSVLISEGDANSESMISSSIILSFINISFILPETFLYHYSLIQSSASSSQTSVSSSFVELKLINISFQSNFSSQKINYTIIEVEDGNLLVEDCTFSFSIFQFPFIHLSPSVDEILLLKLSVSYSNISSSSIIAYSFSDAKKMDMNSFYYLPEATDNCGFFNITQSSFDNIIRTEKGSTIICFDLNQKMKITIQNCSFKKCVSEMSEEGGAMLIQLNDNECFLHLSSCSVFQCACSKTNGRGGGMMFDFSKLYNPSSSSHLHLPLKLENIKFIINDAFVGKDVFILCKSIEQQVNETLFLLDYSQDCFKSNYSICGSDDISTDVDLLPFITFLFASQIFVSLTSVDTRQCGLQNNPCRSISNAITHIQHELFNAIIINVSSILLSHAYISDISIKSIAKTQAIIHFNNSISQTGNEKSVIETTNDCAVERCQFSFDLRFETDFPSILRQLNGSLEISSCAFLTSDRALVINSTLIEIDSGELNIEKLLLAMINVTQSLFLLRAESVIRIENLKINSVFSNRDSFFLERGAQASFEKMFVENCTTDSGSIIYVINGSDELTEKGKETNYGCFNTTISSFTDIYVSGLGKSVIDMRTNEMPIIVSNCSFQDCSSNRMKGSIVQLTDCHNVTIQQCYFDHLKTNFNKPNDNSKQRQINEVCRWNGSAVDATNSELTFKDTTIANFRDGGLSLSTGTMTIEKGEFLSNNPFIEKYPSVRRNIICSDSGTLTISSLKGGDGVMLNSSVWILDGGCTLGGIAGERESPFFIPKLEDVSANENGSNIVMKFNGKLLLPCDLSFRLLYKTGDVELVETYPFEEDSFVSETEVIGTIQSDNISKIADETEVSVMIVFGKQLASTPSQILKNKSESRINGNERIVEGGKEQKSFWPIIVIIMAIILMIVLIVSIIATVRWRKQKRRTEELEVIVEDTVRKDPKAFEMVTMEMSLEEQWRRAEREAEKKNEEKIKKRVYEKSLGHSESSEHLLSESGSTEYILGKDSDKIPDWAFEKVDEKEEEEEETRKRTLSPSISSTSTTDSDSTFVRGEDLCPTTSSMSNLVDAMACSSPHEKLIVDLRDSLFMLLHGRNEKKEMAIGSLQEREQTASQILFWVANLALHSFDEMENSLQSLANLSPHIVLFSEHMVICIVMHSDFSSDHDSDSSSISSSTVVSSASDDDDDSLPSSAFEDEDDLRKECLRWKAPELLMNKKMGATKESVAFSIGMMLWECLTLQLPFGDYPAEVSGQKIVNGERPDLRKVLESSYTDVLHRTFSPQPDSRTTLIEMKREFIQRFPAGAVMLTISDAIDFENESEDMGSDVIDSIPMSNGS